MHLNSLSFIFWENFVMQAVDLLLSYIIYLFAQPRWRKIQTVTSALSAGGQAALSPVTWLIWHYTVLFTLLTPQQLLNRLNSLFLNLNKNRLIESYGKSQSLSSLTDVLWSLSFLCIDILDQNVYWSLIWFSLFL